MAASGINKKSEKGRKRFAEYLASQEISDQEIERIIRYRYELENRVNEREENIHN